MTARNPFNPERDDPRNGATQHIAETYDRLVDAGHEDAAAKLRSRRMGVSAKASMARSLAEEHLTPDTHRQKVDRALEERNPPEEERETVESRLARADVLQQADEDYAEGLRESALALAKYGPPDEHVDALDSETAGRVHNLLRRADTMSGVDTEVSGELREEARDLVEEAVVSEWSDDAEQFAIDRDVKATMEALEEQDPDQQGEDTGRGSPAGSSGDEAKLSARLSGLDDSTRREVAHLAKRVDVLEDVKPTYAAELRGEAEDLAGVDDFEEITAGLNDE